MVLCIVIGGTWCPCPQRMPPQAAMAPGVWGSGIPSGAGCRAAGAHQQRVQAAQILGGAFPEQGGAPAGRPCRALQAQLLQLAPAAGAHRLQAAEPEAAVALPALLQHGGHWVAAAAAVDGLGLVTQNMQQHALLLIHVLQLDRSPVGIWQGCMGTACRGGEQPINYSRALL